MAGGLAEQHLNFNNLAVGETAAAAWLSRENAKGGGIPPLLSFRNKSKTDTK
jgi:hypothetical protein